jgi:putative spermidine/putrescine transport system permease protein
VAGGSALRGRPGRTRRAIQRGIALLPVVVLAGFLTVTLLLPLGMLIVSSFAPEGAPSLATYRALFGGRAYRQAVTNSLLVAALAAAVATLLGGGVALAVHALRSRAWPETVTAVAGVAANAGGPPLAFAFVVLLGTQGMVRLALLRLTGVDLLPELGSYAGLVLVYLYFLVPIVLLAVVPALGAVRPEIYEAALMLGARPRQFWRHVGLPLLLPPLAAGYVLAFAVALGSYSTPWALVGGGGNLNLLPMQIGFFVGEAGYRLDMADAMAVVLIVLAGLCAVAHRMLVSRAYRDAG